MSQHQLDRRSPVQRLATASRLLSASSNLGEVRNVHLLIARAAYLRDLSVSEAQQLRLIGAEEVEFKAALADLDRKLSGIA